MSRAIRSRELAKLGQITRARELAALSELSQIAAERAVIEDAIAALRGEDHSAATPADLHMIEKWRLWKSEELRRLWIRLAALNAEHREITTRCGRAVAENKVVEKLVRNARLGEQKTRVRGAALTSPDERCR